jgi:hypothetical protein
MKSGNLLLIWVFVSAILLSACELKLPPFEIDKVKYAEVIEREAAGPGDLIRKAAISEYETAYFLAINNRAFAQSASGNWAWSKGFVAPGPAMDAALAKCQRRNQAHEVDQPCKVVNVNGYWIARFFNEQ